MCRLTSEATESLMLALHSGSKIDGPAFAQREVIFERQNNTKEICERNQWSTGKQSLVQ